MSCDLDFHSLSHDRGENMYVGCYVLLVDVNKCTIMWYY